MSVTAHPYTTTIIMIMACLTTALLTIFVVAWYYESIKMRCDKRKRYKLYRKMYDMYWCEPARTASETNFVGFCYAIQVLDIEGTYTICNLPELQEHNPRHGEAYWFPQDREGYHLRREILRQILKIQNNPASKLQQRSRII